MIVPEWLFKEEQAPVKNKIKIVCNSKTLKQIARENIKLNDKELAKKINNPYYFINEILKIGSDLIYIVIKLIMQILY